MPITISGSTGIAGVDGSASTPAVQGTDTNTGIVFPAADTVTVATGGTERMRIDSSGNVGIGTSPSNILDVRGASSPQITINNTSATSNDSTDVTIGTFGGTTSYWSRLNYNASQHIWKTFGTERARLDTSGNFMVGTTTQVGSSKLGVDFGTSGDGIGITNSTTGDRTPIAFYNGNGFVGRISTSGSVTAYLTSSDYRLKHDVQPLTSGLATIASLKPTAYKWNADNSYGEGFIAHELQAVIPQAVTGEKDAVNDDGSIRPQGVDYSKIVVHLVAAIQELKADNDAMKERIATLEAK